MQTIQPTYVNCTDVNMPCLYMWKCFKSQSVPLLCSLSLEQWMIQTNAKFSTIATLIEENYILKWQLLGEQKRVYSKLPII